MRKFVAMSKQAFMLLAEERLATPIGEVVILTDATDTLRVLDFGDYQPRMYRLLDRHYGKNGWSINSANAASGASRALKAYFDGDVSAIENLLTATGGTTFQRAVWSALSGVRPGSSLSYTDLARAVGRPTAMRAVGLANGANPIAIIVPCHRIIGRSGNLTGYGGGLARKRWLLDHEARHAAHRVDGVRDITVFSPSHQSE